MADIPSSETWVNFFQDAGIPEELSAQYAVLFSDHRIQKDMLSELDRDILSDIGIRAVGDKMAILKHARFVSEQSKRDASSKQLVDGLKLSARKKQLPAQTKAQTKLMNPQVKKIVRAPPVSSESNILLPSSVVTETLDPVKRSVFQRLGEGKANPTVATPASQLVTEIPYCEKVEESSVLQRLGDRSTSAIVTPNTKKKVVTLKKKAVLSGRKPAVDQQLKPAIITKPSVLDRLGRAVVDEPNQNPSEELVSKLIGDSGTTIKKRNLIKIPQKRRSDSNEESPILPPKKPISSNAVSSTSAGLFRGRTKCSSVFDRLGAKS